MRLRSLPLLLLAAAAAVAQSPQFAAPVRLKAGDKFLGENRLYPSPVYHDLDGDKIADIVVGDLPGRLTVAYGVAGKRGTFKAEEKVLGEDGKDLDFGNW
jgi:hypothetical protein